MITFLSFKTVPYCIYMYTFLSLHSLLYRNRLGSVRVSAGIVVFKNSIYNVALLSIDNFQLSAAL